MEVDEETDDGCLYKYSARPSVNYDMENDLNVSYYGRLDEDVSCYQVGQVKVSIDLGRAETKQAP